MCDNGAQFIVTIIIIIRHFWSTYASKSALQLEMATGWGGGGGGGRVHIIYLYTDEEEDIFNLMQHVTRVNSSCKFTRMVHLCALSVMMNFPISRVILSIICTEVYLCVCLKPTLVHIFPL